MREEPDDDLLHEMAFSWPDIEKRVKAQNPSVYAALRSAYRVEAVVGENSWGDPQTVYDLHFDATDEAARASARVVKDADNVVETAIKALVTVWDRRYTHNVRVAPRRPAGDVVVCERLSRMQVAVCVE